MNLQEIARKLENLACDVEKAESIQLAIFQAVYRGDYALKTYEWAFAKLSDMLVDLKIDLNNTMDDLFDYLRETEKRCRK